MAIIDDLIPEPHVSSRHSRWVGASAEAALAAARAVTASELRPLRPLWFARTLPVRLTGKSPWRFDRERSLLDQGVEAGFQMLAQSSDEIVHGWIGRPWRPGGGTAEVDGVDSFRTFDEPGWAQVAVCVGVHPEEDGVRLVTETRIRATDDAARRAVRRYWWLIGPWSGLIRRSWLRAAAKRARPV